MKLQRLGRPDPRRFDDQPADAKNVFLWQEAATSARGQSLFHLPDRKAVGKRRIMEVYLNVAETGIGTYGANAVHSALAMTPARSRRPSLHGSRQSFPPKKRGAIAPKGFTRRYGNTIAARIGQVRRDGLDACVYAGTTAPKDKAPPPSTAPRELPGEEYGTATLPASERASVDEGPVEEMPLTTENEAVPTPEPSPTSQSEVRASRTEPPPAAEPQPPQ